MGFLGSADIESVFAGTMESRSIETSDARMGSLGSTDNQYDFMQNVGGFFFLHLASHNNCQNLSAVVASPGNRQASPMTAIESISALVTTVRSVGGKKVRYI